MTKGARMEQGLSNQPLRFRIAEIPAGYLGTAGRIGRLADGDIAAIKAILAEIAR